MWTRPLALLVAYCLIAVSAEERTDNAASLLSARPALEARTNTNEAHVCVVVRTYWGHGPGHSGSLERLLSSLRWQAHQRCRASACHGRKNEGEQHNASLPPIVPPPWPPNAPGACTGASLKADAGDYRADGRPCWWSWTIARLKI